MALRLKLKIPFLFALGIFFYVPLSAQVEDIPEGEALVSESSLEEAAKEAEATQTETATNEDPEAARRAEREAGGQRKDRSFDWRLYGSMRVNAISAFDPETGKSQERLGDGASRIGAWADWHLSRGWLVSGRVESGFDVLDTFTTRGQNDDGGALTARLYNLGVESDWLYLKYGKSWSTYYRVAGEADRFSIFGGKAAGIYNAGTDGGPTGTGRADNALQTRLFIDFFKWADIKPFNLNLQFQDNEPIPQVQGRRYGQTWSASAWFETDRDVGVGVAWHSAAIDDQDDAIIRAAGIDGDAEALSVAVRTYGDKWLASLVIAWHDNIETTDQNKYIKSRGVELFAQWQFRDRWWLIGGGNWLDPDDEDPDAGEYEIRYYVLGMRYTFDSFNRMLYFEWRKDFSKLTDGTPSKNEFTVGVRWDFGY